MTNLAIRNEIVGPDQIAAVDIGLRDELIDLDGVSRLQGDVVEFVLADFNVGVGIDLIALDDVFGADFLSGVGVDLDVFDAMAGPAVG